MDTPPTHGLGAAAIRAWLERHGKPAKALAEAVGVSPAAVHGWMHAGWLDGGALPRAYYRRKIVVATAGEVPEYLFEQDEDRREAHRRTVAEAA